MGRGLRGREYEGFFSLFWFTCGVLFLLLVKEFGGKKSHFEPLFFLSLSIYFFFFLFLFIWRCHLTFFSFVFLSCVCVCVCGDRKWLKQRSGFKGRRSAELNLTLISRAVMGQRSRDCKWMTVFFFPLPPRNVRFVLMGEDAQRKVMS